MSRAVRVLQVALRLDPGGTEHLVVELARRLPSRFESHVCCLEELGAWGRELRDDGIPVHELHRRPGFRPSLSRHIAEIARRESIDVLHCHQYSAYVYGCLAKLLHPRLRLVFTEHGRLSDAPPSRKRRLVNPWLARVPGQRFAVCRELKEFLVREGFPADRLGVIYNGIDLGADPSARDREGARATMKLPPDCFLVGTVARLDPVKDHAGLLDAFAGVRRSAPDAHLVLIGDGPEREALRAGASGAGLDSAVTFLGARDDVRDLLPGLDLYVNSSRYEGVSLTIVEAMAAGLPIVATRVGGTPEVLEGGTTGVLVPAGNAPELERAIVGLASDARRRRQLARAARAAAEARFSFDRMLAEYVRAYAPGG